MSGQTAPDGCLFCAALAAGEDEKHWILERAGTVFILLNAYPYASGHVMIATNRHVASPEELDGEESRDLMRAVRRTLVAVRTVYQPHGFNVGVNIGRAAGAGVEGHLHCHVVPRWTGDTNFMPVVGAARVMPESLNETFRRLRPHLTA